MSGLTVIDRAAAVLDALKTCLCAELAARGAEVCSCTILRGVQALPDSCGCGNNGCGRAWVRLDRIFPSTAFPVQDNTEQSCSSMVAAVIEVGTLRCVPTMTANGSGPSDLDQTQAALDAVVDASAMYAALTCCPAIKTRKAILGLYLPRDAADCGGGTWAVTVQLSPDRERTPVGGP